MRNYVLAFRATEASIAIIFACVGIHMELVHSLNLREEFICENLSSLIL